MLSVIKKERVQLTTARFLLGSGPSQLFLSFASAVGAVASSAFRVFASLTYAVRSCSPSAPSLRLLLRSVAFGFTRYRLFASLRRSGFLWLRFRRRPRVRHTPPAPTTVGESVRLCNLPTAHPHVSADTKKGRRRRLPSGVQNVTLPIATDGRAWTIPTPSRPPSPGDTRTAPTGCGHPRPERQRHRDGEPGFR